MNVLFFNNLGNKNVHFNYGNQSPVCVYIHAIIQQKKYFTFFLR